MLSIVHDHARCTMVGPMAWVRVRGPSAKVSLAYECVRSRCSASADLVINVYTAVACTVYTTAARDTQLVQLYV